MKRLCIFFISVVCVVSLSFAQGKFSATLANTQSVLTFKLRPDVTTTTGFSTIEFFLRYAANSPEFNYGPVTVNTNNFPGMAGTGTTGSGAWEIERNNPLYMLDGYNVDHFIYTAPAPTSGVRSYIGGTEYDLISITVFGVVSRTVDFQFIHENTESKYYLAITGEQGNDLRPASASNYFYPATSTTAGPSGSTFYYLDRLAVPLPSKLSSFTANDKGCEVGLVWKMSQETNASFYALERSVNNNDFKEIGRVKAVSTGASSTSYALVDKGALQGNNFYRLKMEDIDGKFEYSGVKQVAVNCQPKDLVAVYPTLTNGIVYVKLPASFEYANVRVVNTLGAEVMIIKGKGLNRTISLENLANGTYIVQVIQNGETAKHVKVVLQH